MIKPEKNRGTKDDSSQKHNANSNIYATTHEMILLLRLLCSKHRMKQITYLALLGDCFTLLKSQLTRI